MTLARLKHLLPLALLIAGLLALWAFGLRRDLSWASLSRHQAELLAAVAARPVETGSVYIVVYAILVACSVPEAAIVTVAGGLLFGTVIGCALTVTGATIGASILLVVVRSAFAQTLDRHRHRIPEQVRIRLERDGFGYLLALRLVPLFPFWIVNLAAAVAGIRLAVFVPATLLGIAPASFVLSSIGAGVGTILAEGRTPDLSVLFSARVLLPLLGLAVLSLLPALLRRRPGAHA